LVRCYRDFFAGSPLVDVRAEIPEVTEVRATHKLIIGGFSVDETKPHRVALVCVLDNLLKGAASQAIQNLNLAFGLDAMMGLGKSAGSR